MAIYGILLLFCLAILSFFLLGGGRQQFTPNPSETELPPNLEFQEQVRGEEFSRILATLIFAVVLIFLYFWASYAA